MFTGLIESIGEVVKIEKQPALIEITVSAPLFDDLAEGDSVAVNGVCLTAINIAYPSFTFQIVPETVACTTFGTLQVGTPVNLERALKADGRLGGHFVQGHVDGIVTLVEKKELGEGVFELTFTLPSNLAPYFVHKGSVALNGISLTLKNVSTDLFSVAIIPHTAENTTLDQLKVGDPVHIEADLLAKYTEKITQCRQQNPTPHGVDHALCTH